MNDENWDKEILEILNADTDDFVELAKIAGLDVQHDFSGADLIGVDLTNAELAGCDFSDADLSNATIRNTNFTGANLTNVTFRGADLTGANLTEADLRFSDFLGARLQDTIFTGSSTFGARNLSPQYQDQLSKSQINQTHRKILQLRLSAGLWGMVQDLIFLVAALATILSVTVGLINDVVNIVLGRRMKTDQAAIEEKRAWVIAQQEAMAKEPRLKTGVLDRSTGLGTEGRSEDSDSLTAKT